MSGPQQHQNPDYYAETASLGPTPHNMQQHQPQPQRPLQSNPTPSYPQQQQQYQHPPASQQQQQQQQQQYYYPPPPTAPQSQQQQQSQQYYYPPPPTGPQQQPSPVPPASSPGKPPGSSGSGNPSHASSKPTFGERLHQWSVKAGVPINKLTNQLGSEAFWPSGMDKECDKAARILQSFSSKSTIAPVRVNTQQ